MHDRLTMLEIGDVVSVKHASGWWLVGEVREVQLAKDRFDAKVKLHYELMLDDEGGEQELDEPYMAVEALGLKESCGRCPMS